MFGDLMGNMEEKQKAMRKKLAEITVEAEAGDGAVRVQANANREIINIAIDREKLDWEDTEMVEDLVTVAVNLALERAAEKESEESERLIREMLPPGMEGLSGMFG
jgi:hypothetical protein